MWYNIWTWKEQWKRMFIFFCKSIILAIIATETARYDKLLWLREAIRLRKLFRFHVMDHRDVLSERSILHYNFLKVAHCQEGERNASTLLIILFGLKMFFSLPEIGRWTNGNDFLPRHLVLTDAWVHKGYPIFIVSRFLS